MQTFTNLETGEVYGGTRTETLQAIREKVGLTAQQFGRAVMLAQATSTPSSTPTPTRVRNCSRSSPALTSMRVSAWPHGPRPKGFEAI